MTLDSLHTEPILLLKDDILTTFEIYNSMYHSWRRTYVLPHMHQIYQPGKDFSESKKDAGLCIRAYNSKDIVTNTVHKGGIVCFLDKKYEGQIILAVRVIRVQKRSLVVDPTEWIELSEYPVGYPGDDIARDWEGLVFRYKAVWHGTEKDRLLRRDPPNGKV